MQKLQPTRERRKNLKQQFLDFVEANPFSSAEEIAAALDCSSAYVRATSRRNNKPLLRRNKMRTAAPTNWLRLSDSIYRGLRKHSEARCTTVNELAERILETCISEKMIDAVLDDEVSA
jgi:hypothetical protein